MSAGLEGLRLATGGDRKLGIVEKEREKKNIKWWQHKMNYLKVCNNLQLIKTFNDNQSYLI